MSGSIRLEKTIEINQHSIQLPLEDEDEKTELMEQAEQNKRVNCLSLCLPISFMVIALVLAIELLFIFLLSALRHGPPFLIGYIVCALFCHFLVQFHRHVNAVLPLVPILLFFYAAFSFSTIYCYCEQSGAGSELCPLDSRDTDQ